MKHRHLKKKYTGIQMISNLYLILIFIYLAALSLFSTRLTVLGRELAFWPALGVHLFFMLLYLFLYFSIRNFKEKGFWTAIILHIFFALNGLLMLFDETPFLEIIGVHSGAFLFKTQLIATSIVINILIFAFLASKSALFFIDKD